MSYKAFLMNHTKCTTYCNHGGARCRVGRRDRRRPTEDGVHGQGRHEDSQADSRHHDDCKEYGCPRACANGLKV